MRTAAPHATDADPFVHARSERAIARVRLVLLTLTTGIYYSAFDRRLGAHRLAAPVLAVAWLYAANVSVFEPFARARSARGATATRIVLTAADALIALAWCEATGAIDSPWVVALYVAALCIPLRFGFRAAIAGGVLYALAYFGVCAAQRLLTQHLAAVVVQTTHLAGISVIGSILVHAVLDRQIHREQLVRAAAEADRSRLQAIMNHVELVSHDLRSPLAAIAMRSTLLGRILAGKGLVEEARHADVLRSCGRRLDHLIQDLMDSSHLDAMSFAINTSSVRLAEILARVVDQVVAPGQRERVRIEDRGAVTEIMADPDRIERVVVNLVSNALKYSPSSSPVVVTIHVQGTYAAVTVSDCGAGIPPDEQAHLFDRGFRGRRAGTTRGFGLGLYISKMIVEAHGGELRVVSNEGRGSQFTFTLPLTPHVAAVSRGRRPV